VSLIRPSYQDVNYLLRAVPNSGFAPNRTIGSHGCNLTSTVNIMSFFGINASPIQFQNWLIGQYAQVTCSPNRFNFINADNDFGEPIVLAFTQELVNAGQAPGTLRYRGPHRATAANTNFARILSELRAGRPVKLRLPNCNQRFGHYVMAYGLKDPTKADAAMTLSDILLHDPYHRRDTLADYNQIFAATWGANWLEDNQTTRVQLYEFRAAAAPPPRDVRVRVNSPVEIVLTDPLGRRVGLDPALGAFAEIPGATYTSEVSYDSIEDPVTGVSEPVWGTLEPRKNADVLDALTGPYTLEVIGTGTGSYAITVTGTGDLEPDLPYITGTTVLGQRQTFNIGMVPRARIDVLTSPQVGMPLNFRLTSPADPGQPYVQGASFGTTPGIPAGSRVVPLNYDFLLVLSLTTPSLFSNFSGNLDANAQALTTIYVPPDPILAGFGFFTAFVTIRAGAPANVGAISDPVSIMITL
jgi:hypothetical protein